MLMGQDNVSELWLPTGLLFIPQMIYMRTESHGRMIITGENRRIWRKNLSQHHSVHNKSTWTDPSTNPGLRGNRLVTNCLSYAWPIPCLKIYLIFIFLSDRDNPK
jgi:hypothetical protein